MKWYEGTTYQVRQQRPDRSWGDWSPAIKAVNDFGVELRGIGRRLYRHMHPEIEQRRHYRRQQHQLRAHVDRQCAGNRRRQRR